MRVLAGLVALVAVIGAGSFLTNSALKDAAKVSGSVRTTSSLIKAAGSEQLVTTAERHRVEHALAVAHHHHVPFVVPDAAHTIVLPPRPRAYRVRDLIARAHGLVARTPAGAVVIPAPIVVEPGATLRLLSQDAAEILLADRGTRLASIVSVRGAVQFLGSPGRPLRVSSVDELTGRADVRETDGRAYVRADGGSLVLSYADLSYLGFGTGATSGIAWLGTHTPVQGSAVHSSFTHNRFGAYAFAARGLRFDSDVFSWNEVYGLDPHDGSTSLLVSRSVAQGNGRHGFVVSRGCDDATFVSDVARDNGEDGFVVDDGHVAADGDPRHASAVPSNRATLRGDSAVGNRQAGFWIEGGAGSTLQTVQVSGSAIGIAVRDDASNTKVTAARVGGARIGLALSAVTGTRLTDVSVLTATDTAIRVDGAVRGTRLQQVTLAGRGPAAVESVQGGRIRPFAFGGTDTRAWIATGRRGDAMEWAGDHPVLVAWASVLGLPMLLTATGRVWRRRRIVALG